ncbi:hypothetical protein SAY86_019140 [Trapa natans]|uniref:Protein ENHANCED DISEASE RESISTANCE 2 C-terminal domain-containing protein n=1 Tax=Trapa natans TaxID=22666 RepID=A0AAN7QZI2_TRANT|nr:hypothetical protein SAY86_019140 [Trapa natans]
MGGCVSAPRVCVGGRMRPSKMRKKKAASTAAASSRKRRKVIRKRSVLSSHRSSDGSLGEVDLSRLHGQSPCNPTLQGSVEEAWFDSVGILDSECDEEEYWSIPDDALSMNGIEGAYRSSTASNRDSLHGESFVTANSNRLDAPASHSDDVDATARKHTLKKPVFIDDMTLFTDDTVRKDEDLLDNCGIIPANCLPCLASTVSPVERRRSLSSSPPGARKKVVSKLSFKWREGHANATLFSSKPVLQRPIAGSQVSFCPIEKKMLDCWSFIEPSSFKVRGQNYFRDKKKDFAPNHSAYYPFGVDVFLTQRKIEHIARFVELPPISSSGKLPPILVVNVQIPLYPAALFQSENDGEGMSIVLYFKLSDSYQKEQAPHFHESILKVLNDEVEKVRSFPVDTTLPFRERLKILGRVANVEDLHLSAAERKLMQAYNEKPVLSRPQHEFFSGENYFEIDVDMHRFSYISRKGFEAFFDRLKLCILDVGLTIQGNKAEELPEHVLCCVRLSGIDYKNYPQLGSNQEHLH